MIHGKGKQPQTALTQNVPSVDLPCLPDLKVKSMLTFFRDSCFFLTK